MANNINFNKNKGTFSFYSRKEVPWHKLGQYIDSIDNAEDALKAANLDYTVKSGPVVGSFIPKGGSASPNNDGTYTILNSDSIPISMSKTKGKFINGYKFIYREDTKDIFDIVSERYEIVQNIESLDIIYGIIKGPEVTDRTQIKIQTAGALNNGETIFVTAKLPSYMISVGGVEDVIDKYILFTTSHNKSSQLTATITDIRVVCNNTLNLALSKSPNKVQLKHTKNVRDRFDDFKQLLHLSNKYSKGVKEVLEHLTTVKVTDNLINRYINDLFLPDNVKKDYASFMTKNGNMDILKTPTEVVSTRSKNKIKEVREYILLGPGQNVAKGSAYWLYNGVTSYISNGIDYGTNEDRFKSLSDNSLIPKAMANLLTLI